MKSTFTENAEVLNVERFTDSIFRLTLNAPQIAKSALPGQFVMVKTFDGHDPLLRRPFSIHQATANGRVQFLIKAIGKGTRLLSVLQQGEFISLVGPLGKGFEFKKLDEKVCLVAGGMGIAPMLYLSKKIIQMGRGTKILLLFGAQNKLELVPLQEFKDMGVSFKTATDDGSSGHHGFVTEILKILLNSDRNWTIFTCGPLPMLRKVAHISNENNIRCQVSLETMMACGVGACLGCVAPKPEDKSEYLHICTHGPVLEALEIDWDHWEI